MATTTNRKPRTLIYCDSDGGVKTLDRAAVTKYLGHCGFSSDAEFEKVTGVKPEKMVGMHWVIQRDRVMVYGPATVATVIKPRPFVG